MKQLVIIGILLISGNWALGQQLKEFSEDQTQMLDQLEKYMTASNRKDLKLIVENFRNHVEGGRFTDTQVVKIRGQFNMMLANKMRANPYFTGFLSSINALVEKGLTPPLRGALQEIGRNIEDRRRGIRNRLLDLLDNHQ